MPANCLIKPAMTTIDFKKKQSTISFLYLSASSVVLVGGNNLRVCLLPEDRETEDKERKAEKRTKMKNTKNNDWEEKGDKDNRERTKKWTKLTEVKKTTGCVNKSAG